MLVEKRQFKLHEAAIIMNMAYNTLKAKILSGQIAVILDASAQGRGVNPGVPPKPNLRGAKISADEIMRHETMNQTRLYARPA